MKATWFPGMVNTTYKMPPGFLSKDEVKAQKEARNEERKEKKRSKDRADAEDVGDMQPKQKRSKKSESCRRQYISIYHAF